MNKKEDCVSAFQQVKANQAHSISRNKNTKIIIIDTGINGDLAEIPDDSNTLVVAVD